MVDHPITTSLYLSHREGLVSYASRLTRDRAAGEDIVHEAWLLLDRRLASAEVRDPLAYLRTIIRNLVLERIRRRDREAEWTEDSAAAVDERPSPEAEVAARQELAAVLTAIDRMPARQRRAIRLYHLDGLKLREVAEALGVSLSYAHSLIADGMVICDRARRPNA